MKCAIPKCRNEEVALFYYGKPVCPKHWKAYCDGRLKIKEKLNIK